MEVEFDGEAVDPWDLAAKVGTVHLITAWNPQSSVHSPEENLRFATELKAVLDGLDRDCWPSVGRSHEGTWSEEGWCVAGLDRPQACDLGLRFGQDAVFEITEDSVLVVWCDDGRIVDVTGSMRGA